MAQFRYSTTKFRTALIVATAITLMVAGLTWMMTGALDQASRMFWTAAAALVFFAMLSASMLIRFFRQEVIVAVRPTGLFDARYSPETIPWEQIRDITLRRTEDEYMLDVYFWYAQEIAERKGNQPEFTMDLSTLDAEPERIIRAIAQFKDIRATTDLQFA